MRAGFTFMSAEVERRSSATDRTVLRVAVVKPDTITTWVTVARPFRSSMGIISLNMVSVTIGVNNGINPATRLTARIVRQSCFQHWRTIKRRNSDVEILRAGRPG